ncbi:serine/threonine protein kinase Japonica Group [Beauveria bassiana ARSEF 2860]|uniref:Serine/threonine protein kinase Japonica Group n=1 Tax=Beauveria bassiana (strain ARSEF 2860) TaxID=655819 RepID=J4VPQ0_BEAB2|nr:serine/threonine protein kinase Japonica Group [Beauveria bassiana ARSEF 2860]EJP60700.1 serine/threonine protein kinase Japonica Group [Beauveria bassiana ARSEF 2860]
MSSDYRASYWLHWQSASGAEICEIEADPERFNFLSFLATAQALKVEFLPIAWDASGAIGAGGTSMIHQTLVNLDTSFAFKTYRKRDKTEEQIFRTLIAEITILSQPFIQEHANIVQLQGICWDISPDNDKPWPVLVFEKSHLGDLYHFATNEGRNMTFEERLTLCADIGRAVIDVHSNHIVHGNLKPENVLVFQDNARRYSARVIDFGYSTKYADEDQPLILPISEPWNAPENNGRVHQWTPRRAVKADLFCFGVLCVWLMFEPRLCGTAALSQSVEGSTATLRWMKGKLLIYAQQLSKSETALGTNMMTTISEFFGSSLSQDPEKREINCIERFLFKLDPQW